MLQNIKSTDGDVIVRTVLGKVIDNRKVIAVSKMLSALPAA